LGPGLLTFTGETGAGKVYYLDAIMALVGGKVDPTFIRAGPSGPWWRACSACRRPRASARLCARFWNARIYRTTPTSVTSGAGDPPRGAQRGPQSTGAAWARACCARWAPTWWDIHGQSEHLSLLNVRSHIGLLDRYAEKRPLLAGYREDLPQAAGRAPRAERAAPGRGKIWPAGPTCWPSRPRRSNRPS